MPNALPPPATLAEAHARVAARLAAMTPAERDAYRRRVTEEMYAGCSSLRALTTLRA